MKVFRIEHRETGLGPFIGPKSHELCQYIQDLIWQNNFPVSKFDDTIGFKEFFAVKSLDSIRSYFYHPNLISMMHDDDYLIRVYKTKSIRFDDGVQLCFRKSSAKMIEEISLKGLTSPVVSL